MNRIPSSVLKLISSLLTLALLATLFWLFHIYDWNHPIVKFLVFSSFFLVISAFTFIRSATAAPKAVYWIEAVVITFVLVTVFSSHAKVYGGGASRPPSVDIGYLTVNAAKLIVEQGRNPYSADGFSLLSATYPLGYQGYYYGPVMMVAYLPGVYFPESGFKYTSIFYALLAAILIALLVIERGQSWGARAAAVIFALTVYVMPERFWFETLSQGANDIFPIMLVLAALLAVKHGWVFLIGLFTGLSFATKFAPAIFLVPFSPIDRLRYWAGFAVGCVPFLPFVFWDLGGLIRNVFLVRFMLKYDSTSLYSVLPVSLHWLLTATILAAVGIALYSFFRQKIAYRTVLVGFTLLLIVSAVTFKEVHGNHLVWFFPLFAVIFTYNREQLFGLISSRFERRNDVRSEMLMP